MANPGVPRNQGEILIVDDSAENRRLLCDLLTSADYVVREAPDGELALMTCFIRPPELMLLDIRMPGMDGYEVCRQLKADPRTRDVVPIIFVSALREIEDKVQGFRAGAVDFITKPFHAEEVLARVHTHVSLARAHKELEDTRLHLEERVRERTSELEQEIGERRRVAEALRTSEQRLRALFEQAAVGVAEVEAGTGRFLSINRRYCEIAGYSQAEMLALNLHDITHPDDLQRSLEHMASLESGALQEYTLEKRYRRKDGSNVWVNLAVSAMRTPTERARCHVAVVQDISERVRAKEDLEQLNATLEQRIREELARNREKDLILIHQSRLAAMGEMVHNIAHQWRQPLNALSVILANIKDAYEFQELTAEFMSGKVAHCHRLLQRMSNTIDDFRDFFRPDREPGEFDISQAVEDALFVMEASLKNNQIDVVKDLPRGLVAYSFSNQFSQVVLNVVANAKDALQERRTANSRIELRLHKDGDKGVLTIRDNAGGIEVAVLPKVFDPYFTTKEKGSGIGLYMSRMILERNLNGTIEVANLDNGTLVTLTLPLLHAGNES